MDFNQLANNRKFQFWTLQLIGWGGWAVTFFMGVLFWGMDHPDNYYFYLPIVSTVGMLVSLLLRRLYKAMWNMNPIPRMVGVVVGSYLAGAGWMASRTVIFSNFFAGDGEKWSEKTMHVMTYFEGATSAWMVMIGWSGLYFGIKYYQLLQVEREQRLKVTAMAHEAQLKMLRYQLNPHFLFNTLNAISTLILDKDNDLANTMVTRLSHFLRYSLDNDPMQKVSLAQELEALRLYLDIEKVRFDERLRLELEIEPAARRALMPSLLLQPLVENAIKYAIAQSVNGGTIRIAARVFAGDLLLELSDDGPGIETFNKQSPKGSGVGLANTRERLKELYGEKQSFKLCKTEPHGLTVSIRLPFEVEQDTE